MGEVRMTGAKWDAQVRGAGKLPGRAMTSQAVQLPHREGGGAATAPFAPSDDAPTREALGLTPVRSGRYDGPAPSGVALPLHSAEWTGDCARPVGARPLI